MNAAIAAQKSHAAVVKRIQPTSFVAWPTKAHWLRELKLRSVAPFDPERCVQYEPRTEFGRRMLELRRAVEASDAKMLTMAEILEEVRLRRGGRA